MGWLGKIFGSSGAQEKMVDGAISGLDKLFYTKEEKSDDHKEMVKHSATVLMDWIKNSQGQNLARRVLAFAIAGTWLFQYWVAMMVGIYGGTIEPMVLIAEKMEVNPALAQVERIQIAIGNNADGMTGAMMLIIGFYFAAPHLSKIIGPAMDKFAGIKIGKQPAAQ